MNDNTNTLEQFVVLRDGHLDTDWLDATLAEQTREKRREMAQTAISATLRRTGLLTRRAAYAALCAVDDYIASAG